MENGDTPPLQQASLGEIEFNKAYAIIDDGPDLCDPADEKIPLGLGQQKGRAVPHVKPLLFGRHGFFFQQPGGL